MSHISNIFSVRVRRKLCGLILYFTSRRAVCIAAYTFFMGRIPVLMDIGYKPIAVHKIFCYSKGICKPQNPVCLHHPSTNHSDVCIIATDGYHTKKKKKNTKGVGVIIMDCTNICGQLNL